ncbi:hypothetical protein [uncultured Gammaproteobacteria bacterium]|nr:hypothetical protein [uncultured Gammaproteobacteria bacterium]
MIKLLLLIVRAEVVVIFETMDVGESAKLPLVINSANNVLV